MAFYLEGGACKLEMEKVVNGYVCPHDGYVLYSYNCRCTNHDNSMTGTFYGRVYKNGVVIKTGSTFISEWSGGGFTVEGTEEVKKGDVISYAFSGPDISAGFTNTWFGAFANTRNN